MPRIPQYIVYKLTNLINGKIYIGRTTRSLDVRWKSHQSGIFARKNIHLKLYKALATYGIENFRAETIYEASSFEELKRKEGELILSTKSHLDEYGYNMSTDTNQGLELYDIESIKKRRMSMHKAQASRGVAKAGIGVRRYRNRFFSNIRYDGVNYSLSHGTLDAAKRAYDMLAIHLYGEHAVLNDYSAKYTQDEIIQNHQAHVDALDRSYSSPYYGVNKATSGSKYTANISKDKIFHHLGHYNTEKEAAIAVDKARLLIGDRGSKKFNFPQLLDQYDLHQIAQWFATLGENRMRGLNLDKRVQKYGVSAIIGGQSVGLGYYEDPMKAAMVRDMAVLFSGSNDELNYPEKIEIYRQDDQYKTITQEILDGKTKYGRGKVFIRGFDE